MSAWLGLIGSALIIAQASAQVGAQVSAPTTHINTPTALSMGQSGRATGRGNTALIYNPAAMSASMSYMVNAHYMRTSAEENIVGINVVDSQTRAQSDRLAVGAAYSHVFRSGDTSGYEGRLGFALPVMSARQGTPELHLGAAGRYVSDELSKRDGFDVDAGLLLNLGGGLYVGAVGESLLESDEGGAQRFGGGVGFAHTRFSVGVDWMQAPSSGDRQLSGGAELLLGERFVLRGGYERLTPKEGDEASWGSGGFALISGEGRGQLNVAYRRSVESGEATFGVSLSTSLDLP